MTSTLQKITISIILAICFQPIGFSQTYTMKKPVSDEMKKEILKLEKQLFEPEISLEYTISSYDLVKSFDDLSESVEYTLDYKKTQEEEIAKNPKSSVAWNNLANYYSSIDNPDQAKKCFQNAYDYLESNYTPEDAFYYSFKGVLKLNLGKEGAIADLKQAYAIDPTDSITTLFLPVMLLNAGEFDEAMTYCEKAVERSEGREQATWFLFYIMSDYFKQFFALQALEGGQDNLARKEFDEVFDLSKVNALYEKHKSNQLVKNAKLMSDILALYFKMVSFEIVDRQIQLKYTKKELKKIQEIKTELIGLKDKGLMNEYSRLKTLGFTSFMQGNSDESIAYFEESITVFPANKSNDQFNSMQSYNALFGIYGLEKRREDAKAILGKIIEKDEKYGPNVKHLSDMAKCAILEDDFTKAYNWAYKAFQASETDFETFRVLAHYSFYIGDGQNLDAYVAEAAPKAVTEDQYYSLSLQVAMYYLANGNAEEGFRFIKQADEIYADDDCSLCTELEKNYIKISK